MTQSIGEISSRVTRPTLIEYSEVLTTIDQLVASARSTNDSATKSSFARQIVQLLRQLKTMEITSLDSTSDLKNLSRALTIRSSQLIQIAENPGSTLLQIANAFSDWLDNDTGGVSIEQLLSNALDPTQWDENLQIRDSIIDYLFYEYFRSAEVMTQQQVGQLGNRLQVSEKFLASINLVYQGATWNPGEEFIDLEGNLRDSEHSSWFEQFTSDGIRDNVALGIDQIQTMYDSGLLPEGSLERQTAEGILNNWNTSYSEGGYAALATQDAVARMWGDPTFKRLVQDGIMGASNLNEQLQHDISRVLMQYDTFTRSASNMATKMNSSIRTLARAIQGNN